MRSSSKPRLPFARERTSLSRVSMRLRGTCARSARPRAFGGSPGSSIGPMSWRDTAPGSPRMRSAVRCSFPMGTPSSAGRWTTARRYVVWEDPHPKPDVPLRPGRRPARARGGLVHHAIRTIGGAAHLRRTHNADRCDHAMRSLKRAMRWDEEVYGLEYDLDVFMIVAVDDFNMGAMGEQGPQHLQLRIRGSPARIPRPTPTSRRSRR